MQELESQNVLNGAIHFQDDASLQRLLNERNLGTGIALTLGIVSVVVSFLHKIPHSNPDLAILAIGICMLIFGVMFAIQKYRPFIIYEQGISTNFPKIPFMRFMDIDHISIWNWARPASSTPTTSEMKEPGGRIIIIYMKSGQKYAVAEFGRGRLDHYRFLIASEIILKRLKETHSNEPESKFIQDYTR
jgi:hypothetical protein